MKNKKDPKYLGIPNICFSLTDKNDVREKKFKKQRLKRGFDDSETWSLRDTIAKFIIPRLKRFKKKYIENIEYDKEFIKKIDKSIIAFELLIKDNGSFILNEKEEKEYENGIKCFNEIFLYLWW